jgi:hypothetical protein
MKKVRIKIPTNVEELLDLARLNAAKHAADGASSILNGLQDYTWNTLADTIPTCLAKHQQAELLRRDTKEAYDQRDRMWRIIDEGVKATRDFLLGVYRATPLRLGDWGFDVVVTNGRVRVAIPENVEQLLALAKLIYQKHVADGATSILNRMQEVSWTTLGPTIQPCLDKHQEAEALDSDREQAYGERDVLLEPIGNAVRATRDLLQGAFPRTLLRLGDWGFDVSQVTRKPRKKKGGDEG